MKDPGLIPSQIKEELSDIGLWDVNPYNLFRITWKNEPVPQGGGFNGVNFVEFPKSLTGIEARVNGSPLARTKSALLLVVWRRAW